MDRHIISVNGRYRVLVLGGKEHSPFTSVITHALIINNILVLYELRMLCTLCGHPIEGPLGVDSGMSPYRVTTGCTLCVVCFVS